MTLILRAFILAVLGLSLACSARQQTPLAAPAPEWRVTFHQSGGFAGFDRNLELANTGEMTVTDRKRAIRKTSQASAKELAEISALMGNLKAVDNPGKGDCRDCLLYDVDVRMPGQSFSVHFDDVSLRNTAFEPLVKVLMNMLDRALSAQPEAQR